MSPRAFWYRSLVAKLFAAPGIATVVSKVLAAIVLAFVAALSASTAFAHGVTFKMRHDQPVDSAFQQDYVELWARKIHDESGARINLLISPGDSATGGSAMLFQMAKERAADIVWLDIQDAATHFPRFAVFGLPLAGMTSEGSSRALWAYVDTNDLAFREFGKMRVLAASRHDAPLFHMREKNVKSLSDLNGTRIAIPNADAAGLLAELGASPIVTPKSGMREALASANVDGVLLSWNSLATLKLEKLVTAHTGFPSSAAWPYSEISVLLMNPGAFRSLADDLEQVVRNNSGADTSAWIGKVFDESAAKARQSATERGDAINMVPSEELKKWQEATEAALSKRARELDGRGLKGESLIGKARELLAEYDTAN